MEARREAAQAIFDADAGVYGRWFPDAVGNVCHNALDRHVAAGRGPGGGRTSEGGQRAATGLPLQRAANHWGAPDGAWGWGGQAGQPHSHQEVPGQRARDPAAHAVPSGGGEG